MEEEIVALGRSPDGKRQHQQERCQGNNDRAGRRSGHGENVLEKPSAARGENPLAVRVNPLTRRWFSYGTEGRPMGEVGMVMEGAAAGALVVAVAGAEALKNSPIPNANADSPG